MTRIGFHCHDLDHLETAITSNGLRRGEFYNLPSQALPDLREEITWRELTASVHAPLVRTAWHPLPPTLSFLCDPSEEKRQLSLRMIRETMSLASELDVEYVVVHFPAPSATEDGSTDYATLETIAWDSASRLAEMSEEHGTPIHIEGFGPSPFLNVDFLTQVTNAFPSLLYCFDTGHMHISAQRDGFDLYKCAEEMAANVGSIHLWNDRSIEDYLAFRHIPVHPSQKPEEGWVDIPLVLRSILSQNPTCRVILESGFNYPAALGGHDFREGVEWVKELVAGLS